MRSVIEDKQLLLYLFISFLISGIVGLGILFSGLSVRSGLGQLMMALLLMPGPALATLILHSFRFSEVVREYGLGIRDLNWKRVIIGTVSFFILYFLLFLLISFLLGNIFGLPGFGHLSFSPTEIREEMQKLLPAIEDATIPEFPSLPILLISSFFSAMFAGFTINMLFALGEELGWRGFLWKKVKKLGFIKANLITGIVWGLWHAPIILQGYNFPHYPLLGVLFMIFFTTALSFPLSFLREKSGSILSAAIVHGMINATGIFSFIVVDKNELLSGTVGITGVISIFLAFGCIWFLFHKWDS